MKSQSVGQGRAKNAQARRAIEAYPLDMPNERNEACAFCSRPTPGMTFHTRSKISECGDVVKKVSIRAL
jgi:hypothetical protein